MKVFVKLPQKAKGVVRLKKKVDKFSLMRNGLLETYAQENMSQVAARQVDLCKPISHKTYFYRPRSQQVCAGRPRGRKCSHISEQIKDVMTQGYTKGLLHGWWDKKNKEEGRILKKTSGHRVIIMADLSKMTLVWCTHHTPQFWLL